MIISLFKQSLHKGLSDLLLFMFWTRCENAGQQKNFNLIEEKEYIYSFSFLFDFFVLIWHYYIMITTLLHLPILLLDKITNIVLYPFKVFFIILGYVMYFFASLAFTTILITFTGMLVLFVGLLFVV